MNSLCDTLQNTMTYLLSLFNDLYCTVRVMIQLIDADGAQPVVARKLAVVVESKPLALEVDDRAVIGIAVGWFHVDTHVGPRAERRVTDSVTHAVVTGHSVIPSVIMVIGIRKIIASVVLVYPSSFMEVFEAGHDLHRTVEFNHVVFKTSAHASASATIIYIGFAVIVNKNARVDKRLHAFDVTYNL